MGYGVAIGARDGTTTVCVTGVVDSMSAGMLGKALEAAIHNATDSVVVDLSGACYLDLAGVEALVQGCALADSLHVPYDVRVLPGRVLRTIELSGAARSLRIQPAGTGT